MAQQLYSWFQDNHSVTIDIYVPQGTLPTQLKLKLAKRRLTLLRVSEGEEDGQVLLRRQTYAPIEPRCTDSYTMPESIKSVVAANGRAAVRAVIYKAVKAGWLSLFVGDAPGQGLVPGPPQVSHAMAHVAALARAKEATAREAKELAARAIYAGGMLQTAPQQNWRTGCHILRKKTPGGIKIHYGRDPPVRATTGDGIGADAAAPPLLSGGGGKAAIVEAASDVAPRRHCWTRQEWGTAKRQPPREDYWRAQAEAEAEAAAAAAAHAADVAAYEAAVAASRGAQNGQSGAGQDTPVGSEPAQPEDRGGPVPSRRDAAAARAAVEAIRKGQAPPGGGIGGGDAGYGGGGDGGESSSDDEYGGWEGEGGHPDDIEYPLPGSDASCDACGQCVNKYYHCVQCGVIKGFDLCEDCHRRGLYPDKHIRRYPNHKLALVTPHTAPIIAKEPKLRQAPPAPPPPMPLPKAAPLSERVIVPFEAKVKYDWSQYSSEVNLTVHIPPGTRARDLIVVVQPFQMSVSLKGYGIILKGSFHKGVRHRETVWTIEEGLLRVMLVKSDGQSWKKLFPHENEMMPMEAIRQVCEDPEPVDHSYMDLAPEGRQLVDLHRAHKHAMATGDYNHAQELEEEMKMMRFNWGKNKDHMQAG